VANDLAMRVEETLRPVIGSVLATVSVDVESKRIGKTPDTLDPSDLNLMADNLVKALNLVVGRQLAEEAASKVRELT
jgi:DNA-binding protein YbaB